MTKQKKSCPTKTKALEKKKVKVYDFPRTGKSDREKTLDRYYPPKTEDHKYD